MPENSLDLIEYLYVQQERFSVVTSHLLASGMKFEWSLSLRYTFMSFNIDLITSQDDEKELLQFYRWKWNMDESQTAEPEIHCPDKDVELLTRNHIHPVSYKTYRTIPVTIGKLFTEEIMKCVKVADEIASQAYQCNSGDNYFPGYFGEIILNRTGISLSQVNRWNSRSADHKDDYTMRELHFSIPYEEAEFVDSAFDQERIGKMNVTFADQSSINNRRCGDLIREKIKLHKLM